MCGVENNAVGGSSGMSQFEQALEKFLSEQMSSGRSKVRFADVVQVATFETMKSEAADEAIDREFQDGNDDEQAAVLEDLIAELPNPRRGSLVTYQDDGDDDSFVEAGVEDDAGDNGMRATDDDEDEAEFEGGETASESSLSLPSDDEATVQVDDDDANDEWLRGLVTTAPQADDVYTSSGDDDDEAVWASALQRGFEDDEPRKKKKTKSKAPAATTNKAKRKLEPTKKATETGLVRRKAELKQKMSAEAQRNAVIAYVKVATLDHVLRSQHTDAREEYKSFRLLVLEEASAGNSTNDATLDEYVHAVLSIEADATETVMLAKTQCPEPMQLLCDFVARASKVQQTNDATPSTATRCDVTQRPTTPAELAVMVAVDAATGASRTMVMGKPIRNLAKQLWTLTNFYDVVTSLIVPLITKLQRSGQYADVEQLLEGLITSANTTSAAAPDAEADGTDDNDKKKSLLDRIQGRLVAAHTSVLNAPTTFARTK